MLFTILSLTIVSAPFAAMEATCSGGIAGRMQKVRLTPDGRLTQSNGPREPMIAAGRLTTEEAKALSQRLDRVSFDTMPTLPRIRNVYDGVSCTLKREGKVWHSVQFIAGATTPSAKTADRYSEVRAVMAAILGASDARKLNPQPIPPEPR